MTPRTLSRLFTKVDQDAHNAQSSGSIVKATLLRVRESVANFNHRLE